MGRTANLVACAAFCFLGQHSKSAKALAQQKTRRSTLLP